MPRYIDVLSDSTGATAERVLRAALLQFPQSEIEIRRHVRVRTRDRAEPILRQVAADEALLVFSVVSPELSDFIHRKTGELRIDAIDVIGSVIRRLEAFLDEPPINRPGALMPLSEEYFRRIEAVSFTVKSDTGRDPRSFLKADLVLAGVSRTSKTPLATLLAQRGLRVASYTVVLGTPIPNELDRARNVVGLTIDVDSLCAIRQERLLKLGMPEETQYAVRAHVEREIAYAETIFSAHPSWSVVDMSDRSIDETAGIILEMLAQEQNGARPALLA
jgi:regulator of PEP synthase PpsR (kinase-PPPase family)